MTKVSIFKLIIGENEYPEYGRNDIYVIFEIDANMIEGTTGVYHIVDASETISLRLVLDLHFDLLYAYQMKFLFVLLFLSYLFITIFIVLIF